MVHCTASPLLVAAVVSLIVVTGVALAGDAGSAEFTLSIDHQDDDMVVLALSTDAENVAGYSANITYDPSIIEFAEVNGADMGDPVTNVDHDEGWVFVTEAQSAGISEPTVATIHFDVLSTGETDLSFVAADSVVNDDEFQHYDLELVGTSVATSTDDDSHPPPPPDDGDEGDAADDDHSGDEDGEDSDDGADGTDDADESDDYVDDSTDDDASDGTDVIEDESDLVDDSVDEDDVEGDDDVDLSTDDTDTAIDEQTPGFTSAFGVFGVLFAIVVWRQTRG